MDSEHTAIQDEVCRRLVEGESLRAICRAKGMPDKSTILRWLAADEDFRTQYAIARDMQAEALADEIIDISDDAGCDWTERLRRDGTVERVLDAEHVQRARLRVDARKWLAAKLSPKKYGDATLLKHADAEGRVVAMSETEIAVRVAALFETARIRRVREGDD